MSNTLPPFRGTYSTFYKTHYSGTQCLRSGASLESCTPYIMFYSRVEILVLKSDIGQDFVGSLFPKRFGKGLAQSFRV
jgi:hypothetical protein